MPFLGAPGWLQLPLFKLPFAVYQVQTLEQIWEGENLIVRCKERGGKCLLTSMENSWLLQQALSRALDTSCLG